MSQQHIVIIDGDPVAALVTAQGLQRMLAPDARVTTSPSAGAAQLYCLKERIDLLIIDPNLQSQATTALIRDLHNYQPAATVLVLSSYDTPRLRNQMQALGVKRYVAKPIELRPLAATVRELLGIARC